MVQEERYEEKMKQFMGIDLHFPIGTLIVTPYTHADFAMCA